VTASSSTSPNGDGGDLPFARDLFSAADQLRGSVESAEYKHLVLGLIFLKYISDSYERQRDRLDTWTRDPENADYFTEDESERADLLNDRDEYISENVFWVPEGARWSELMTAVAQPDIGARIDSALKIIEAENENQLRGVLPRIYARAPLHPTTLGELVKTIDRIGFGDSEETARDTLGRTYEYFIKTFAKSEGHRGGEFYTPASVTRLLVEMLEPYEGRVLDPACGSGGLFVQSAKFISAHGGRPRNIRIHGQEKNQATWRIGRMNLAIHGLSGDLQYTEGGSLLDDQFKSLRADYVLANPPFNQKAWGADRVSNDSRWKYGLPPDANANYAWIQHFIAHLAPEGRAGFVMANGSLSSHSHGEGRIREQVLADRLVDCIVACPSQLFYTTAIPVSLWFLDRAKATSEEGERADHVLFIDARGLGEKVTRTQVELSPDDIRRVAQTYHAWRGEAEAEPYEDVPGFCRSVSLSEIATQRFALTPARYVGAVDAEEEDPEDFSVRLGGLLDALDSQLVDAARLEDTVRAGLKGLTRDA
jgi:type I restriction enzyme M protein